jgi:SAM-dependent methyltransferase
MTPQSGLIRTILRRAIPLELRSYLTQRPSIGIDRATWDREYAAGEWSKLGKLDEMPRYALIAGCSRTIGPAASVLDIGCGEGHLASWLFEDGKRRYLGIDVFSVAIQGARARFKRRPVRGSRRRHLRNGRAVRYYRAQRDTLLHGPARPGLGALRRLPGLGRRPYNLDVSGARVTPRLAALCIPAGSPRQRLASRLQRNRVERLAMPAKAKCGRSTE